MKKEIKEKYFIHNGNILTSDSKELSLDKTSKVIYEVIRVIDGIPLFLEEHIDRLKKSAKLLNCSIDNITDVITMDTKKIITLNDMPEKNLKILIYNIDNPIPDYYIFFIESFYPKKELYQKGIKTISYKAVRDNPQAKVVKTNFRENINAALKKNNAYEALLLNEVGEITEGSRSNVFFVKDGSLYTSPSKDVLLGITRAHIIELCKNLGINVIEQPITYRFLEDCDGLFITGTSPNVLPISQVDDRLFASPRNNIIITIMKSFDLIIKNYIESHK